MTNILTGTADVTSGSPNIVWTGTPLYAGNCPADSQIVIAGVAYFILSLTDTTHPVLTRDYAGSDDMGLAAEISPYTEAQVSTAELNITVANWLRLLQDISGTGVQPNAIGDFASRSAHDTEATGYVYMSLDGDGASIHTAVLFIKNSVTSADWSDPVPIQGEPGTNGADGADGVSAVRFGTTVPSSGLGNDGDLYIRTSTGDLYAKASGAWTLEANLLGPAGATGAGVPVGGMTGQVLAKASNTDNDTHWVTASGGAGFPAELIHTFHGGI